MITTIQLNEDVKKELDKLKKDRDTYEDVIVNLIKLVEDNNKNFEELMIEGAKVTAKESLKITKEFESIENLNDWEW